MTTTDNPQANSTTTPICGAPAGPDSPTAILVESPTQPLPPGPPSPPHVNVQTTPIQGPPVVDPLLFVHVTAHHDLEQQRIASQNRLRILTATTPDEDGVMRGFGLTDSHPDVARLAGITEALVALEHQAELNLKRSLRGCAIHPWVKTQIGLGEKQVARLLGAIGDPYWHDAEQRPRTVSELWAYCGYHVLPSSHSARDTHLIPAAGAPLPADHRTLDAHPKPVGGNQTSDPDRSASDALGSLVGVAAKRRKGQRANWSTDAKTRAYLCATSCVKQAKGTYYRDVYDTRRARTAETHPDWTPGHSHNDALRVTAKEILKQLWRESRRLHGHVDAEVAA